MAKQVISTETIKRQARHAAESGQLIDAYPYLSESAAAAAAAWKTEYWSHTYELSGEATA